MDECAFYLCAGVSLAHGYMRYKNYPVKSSAYSGEWVCDLVGSSISIRPFTIPLVDLVLRAGHDDQVLPFGLWDYIYKYNVGRVAPV